MGTGKQYDEEFKKRAIKLASFRQQTSGSKSLKRKTVSLKSLMNFWRKHLLFSPRTECIIWIIKPLVFEINRHITVHFSKMLFP